MLSPTDKVIFFDTETYYPIGTKKPDEKYTTPILRLLTYQYWDGEKYSKLKQYDTEVYLDDPWEEIRELMKKGFILAGQNIIMFDNQPSLTNHNTKEPDWIVPFLIKGQIWDTMVVDKLISGMNPDKSYDSLSDSQNSIEQAEQEEEELEETEVDGTNLRGFSLKALVWKYCQIKLDKTFQEYKYYIPQRQESHEVGSSEHISPARFYTLFSDLIIKTINLIPEDLLTTFRETIFFDYDLEITDNACLLNKASFEDLGVTYLYCHDYKAILERLNSFLKTNLEIGGLASLVSELNLILEIYNKSIYNLNKYGKGGIVKDAIKYSQDDIKYLPDIYAAQKKQIELFKSKKIDIDKAIDLTHKLGATTYLGQKYGVAVNVADVQKYTKEFSQALSELEKQLLAEFPLVSETNTELVERYTKLVWERGKEIGGIRTNAEFKKALKKGGHAVCAGFNSWKAKYADKFKKQPKLGNYAHVKECLNKLNIPVQDTTFETLKEISVKQEVPIIDTLLKYKEKNALLTKTLTKFTHSCYLRSDDTVPTTYHFSGPANWRSSSKNPNVQNLSRDLKSLFHVPAGMYKISFDLSAVELVKVVDKYQPKLALESFKFPDQHIYFAALYNDLDPHNLYDRYMQEDPEAAMLRQTSKEVTYMNVFKSPCNPNSNYVTGVKKLQQITKTKFGLELSDIRAEKQILNCENIFDTWTQEKLNIEAKIRERYKQYKLERDPQKKDKLRKIGYRGPLGHIAKFYLDDVYDPDSDYVNARSIFSVDIAGFIAVGVKSSVKEINEFFYKDFGFDNARLTLTVHDNNDAYVKPEVFVPAREGYIDRFLRCVYVNSEFKQLPLEIEGYSVAHDFRQVMPDGSLIEVPINDEGKRKYKKEKYRINNSLVISQV